VKKPKRAVGLSKVQKGPKASIPAGRSKCGICEHLDQFKIFLTIDTHRPVEVALALEHWIEHQRKSIKSQFTWVVTEEIGVYCHGQKRRRGENFASIMRIEPRTVIISGSVSGLKFRNLVEVEKLLTNLVENLIVKFGQRTAILFCSGRARTVCVD